MFLICYVIILFGLNGFGLLYHFSYLIYHFGKAELNFLRSSAPEKT